MHHRRLILPVIVFSQFCCTSLWFAGNAVMRNLVSEFHLPESALGHLTSAVQFGFITGTLVFALLTVSDRFSPSRVFLACALIGALFNAGTVFESNNFATLLILRFLTGFFLAGIYPVGMKIAADYYQQGLGKSLGFLVGALVVGTAFPHLLKASANTIAWSYFVVATSLLAVLGGTLMILFVPDGPYRKLGQKADMTAFLKVFKNRIFRRAAFGYFGHMWELYAFWAFVPVILSTYQERYQETSMNVSLLSFLIIGVGGLACVVGGYIAQSLGSKKTASIALFLSGVCCLLSPLIFFIHSSIVLISFLIFWGIVVIADSPLFSTLVAQNADAESKGTALTIVNCVGFSITIISIQLLTALHGLMNPVYIYVPLAIGPILGLMAMMNKSDANALKAK